MPIIQINLFICEQCGRSVTTTKQESLYSDPVIVPPPGWERSAVSDLLLCRECGLKAISPIPGEH